MNNCRRAVTVISSLLIFGCSGDSHVASDSVDTGEMVATFDVVSDGSDQIFAEAQLTAATSSGDASGREYISLTETDQLWLSAGDSFQAASADDDLFGNLKELQGTQARFEATKEQRFSFLAGRQYVEDDRYIARLPRSDDDQYHVALLREHYSSAVEPEVEVPEDFSLYSPEQGDRYSRGNDLIVVEWAPVEPDVEVTVEIITRCPEVEGYENTYTQTSADTGVFTVAAGALEDPQANGECSSTVSVIRTRLGEFDSAFAGGYIAGHQVRSQTIVTVL